MLAPFDEAIEADIPAWKKAFIAQAKSSTLRSPSGLGGDDTYLMQATERALKLLNQKTVKDKQAGDKSSGIAREVFDWGTLGDRQQRSQHPRQNAAQKGSENALGERASQAGRIHGERGCNDTLTGGYLLKLP